MTTTLWPSSSRAGWWRTYRPRTPVHGSHSFNGSKAKAGTHRPLQPSTPAMGTGTPSSSRQTPASPEQGTCLREAQCWMPTGRSPSAARRPSRNNWHDTGVGNFVWVTLQPGTIPKGKHKDGPTIFAYLDGQQAGYISAKQSERYYLYIKRRMPCSCLAYIEQGGKKLELQLMLPARS